MKAQSMLSLALPSPHSKNTKDEDQQPTEATGVGRNWVQSMFTRNTTSRSSSFSRVRRWTSDGGNSDTSCNIVYLSCQYQFVLMPYNFRNQ